MRMFLARRFQARPPRYGWLAIFWLCAGAAPALSQQAPVTADVEIVRPRAKSQHTPSAKVADAANVAVWLIPIDRARNASHGGTAPKPIPQLVQRNKTFEPHVLIVQVGTLVQFPNRDPFFHNIFSLFDGKRFDLGLYEAGSSRTVRFDRPGVSYLFCNIHPEMSAVVIALTTPYFGLSDRSGHVTIDGVPDGRYEMRVWYERSRQADLNASAEEVNISMATRSLGTLHVVEDPSFTAAHKDKYGRDYVPPPDAGYLEH
jgi:plastocyanin